MRSRTASGGGGGGEEMLTARLLTNCSITQHNILTPERISQGQVQTGGGLLFVAHSVASATHELYRERTRSLGDGSSAQNPGTAHCKGPVRYKISESNPKITNNVITEYNTY
jgi:hypothetical protein